MSTFVLYVEPSIANESSVMCLAVACLLVSNPGMSLFRVPEGPKGKDAAMQEDLELRDTDGDTLRPSPESEGKEETV